MEQESVFTQPLSRQDKARLFRSAHEAYQKLTKVNQSTRRLIDLFRPRVIYLRNELRTHGDTLIMAEPVEYGKKLQELMWRSLYHELMQAYKKHKASMKAKEYNLLVAHFQSGIGHYYELLLSLASKHELGIGNILPEFHTCNLYGEDFGCEEKEKLSDQAFDSIKQTVHRTLIYIGDIYRYLDTLAQEDCRLEAVKWYNAAILLDPRMGMPFNQLGTLALNDNYNLESAYYYMRCLTSTKPFDGAATNLKSIFNGAYAALKDTKSKSTESFQVVKRCLCEFLTTLSEFWNASMSAYTLQSKISSSLTCIKDALALSPRVSSATKPAYLDPTLVFQMGAMLLILLDRTSSERRIMDTYAALLNSALVAYTLNYLYFVVSSCASLIRETKITEECMKSLEKLDGEEETLKNKNFEISAKQALSRLRRRKAVVRFHKSDLLFEEDEDEMDQLEETALSTIEALEMSSDLSETGSMCEEFEQESTNSMATSEDDSGSQPNSSSASAISPPETRVYDIRKMLAHMYYESNLPTIKMLCNWLNSNPNIIRTHFDALSALLSTLVDFFNQLLDLQDKALGHSNGYEKFLYAPKWMQKYPLSIDMALSGLMPLNSYFKSNIDFGTNVNNKLSDDQMGFLCIQSVIGFGHALAGELAQGSIKFDKLHKRFAIVDQFTSHGKVNANGHETLSKTGQMQEDGDKVNQAHLNSSKFIKTNLNGLSNLGSQAYDSIMPNMSYLWLDANDNKLSADQTASLSKPKDFCPSRALSA